MKFAFFVHYFPPLNSTGARRVESFAKYLSRNGHEIVVVSTKKSTLDGPLTEAVPPYVRLFEINALGKVAEPNSGTDLAGVELVSLKKRIHWTRRVKQKLMRLIGQVLDPRIGFPLGIRSRNLDARVVAELASADVFVSSFPPWPMHLAAMVAKRRFDKPWLIDYRDQFGDNHVMSGVWPFTAIERLLDRWFVKSADVVTVISPPMKEYYDSLHTNVFCIENGFDQETIEIARKQAVSEPNSVPVVRYLGTIVRDAIPVNFVAAVARIASTIEKPIFRVELRGDTRLLEDHIRQTAPHLIGTWFVFLPRISAFESLCEMLTANVLLFVSTADVSSLSAKGVLTTKLFEYLASGRPIIAETSAGTLAASYIRKASDIHVVSQSVDEIQSALIEFTTCPKEVYTSEFVSTLTREKKAIEFSSLASIVVGRAP